jgi:hypothetical protein
MSIPIALNFYAQNNYCEADLITLGPLRVGTKSLRPSPYLSLFSKKAIFFLHVSKLHGCKHSFARVNEDVFPLCPGSKF